VPETAEPPRENYFGEGIAPRYDDISDGMFDPAVVGATVDFLAGLAGEGRALELAIGTGRIGLPLSRRGVTVAGIDLSPQMLEQLRAKPGADAIETVIGDMTSARIDGSFRLVYLVFNTIQNVTTQDAQVEVFANAAAHLEPGGCFVIEVMVPQLRRLPPGDTAQVFTFSPTHIGFDELDVVEQLGVSHHIWLGDSPRRHSMPWRWAWPAEFDLMARIAGLRLRERWADWHRSPFTSESYQHVSVWEKLSG
jgi:SAM-dependent methyltransferase